MLMMLPFLSGALAVWFGILGKRRPCFALWLVTLAVFAVGAHRYMTGPCPCRWRSESAMIFLRNPGRGSRIVNTLVLLAVSLLLLSALAWQWLDAEAPCPLCLLQRAALVLIGVGLLLNVRMGPSPLHYAMVLAPALGGLTAAGWQLLSPDAGAAAALAGLGLPAVRRHAGVLHPDAGGRPQMGRQRPEKNRWRCPARW